MTPTHFASLIRNYMDVRGVNQAAAARLCKMSESQLSSLINRPRKAFPDADTIGKLYDGLGIPPAETLDAAARDLGLGPIINESLRISEDPEVRAIALVLGQVAPEDRRTLTAIARAYLDNSGDKK